MSSPHVEATSLTPTALVSLYQLDTTLVGGLVYHFTTETRGGAFVKFGGVDFTAVPIQITGMGVSGQGALQTPTLTISNTTGLLQEIMNTWGNLEGCSIKRWRTYARFLDDGPEPDPTAFFGPDSFKIDHRSSDTPEQIQWKLSTLIDQQGMYVGRTIIRDTCLWRYRVWNGETGSFNYDKVQCPYAGSRYFDRNNNQVTNASEDVPARNIGCCRARFGETSTLPFGGFPGIPRGV